MDYKYVEKYIVGDSISHIKREVKYKTSETDVFIRAADSIMHFSELSHGISYIICGNVLLFQNKEIFLKNYYRHVLITKNHVFVAYPERLDVLLHNGKLSKKFTGNFLYKNGLFLQLSSSPYVVDANAHTVFVPQCSGLLDFTETGEVVYVSEPDTEDSSVNYLVIDSLKKRKRKFNEVGKERLKFGDITLYKGNARIENPSYAVHFFVDSPKKLLVCNAVLIASAVWLICGSYAARMEVPEAMYRVVIDRMVAHNFLTEVPFHDLVLAIATEKRLCVPSKAVAEDFLVNMLMSRLAVGGFIRALKKTEELRGKANFSASQVLCRAYRRTDDPGRRILRKYINFKKLLIDELYCVIAFVPRYIDLFVQKCKSENRLFYIYDLIKFCSKVKLEKRLRNILLANGLLFYDDYPGAELLVELEKREANAQLVKYKSFKVSDLSPKNVFSYR